CGSPTSSVTCTALDQCHAAGICDPATGTCSNPNQPDGTGCNDKDACTTGETCHAGMCRSPTSSGTCTALDHCPAAGICAPARGTCANPNHPDGTGCNDEDACPIAETSLFRSCGSPTSSVTCTALDQCHAAGICDPATGTCSNPNQPDGTGCND